MTRNEVLAMKPGRELDALVAEKVMGWKTNWLKTDWWEEINPNTHHHKGLVKDFKPSTDIAAAWEVEEEINKRNLRVAYCQALQIVIRSQKDYVTTFDYVHASPADRCKAALLAVMEE